MMKLDSTFFSCELREDKREYLHEIIIADRKKCFLRLVVEEKLVTLIVQSQFFMNDEEDDDDDDGECCGCFSRWRSDTPSSNDYSPVKKSEKLHSCISISIRHNDASAEEQRKKILPTKKGELVRMPGSENEWYLELGTKQQFYERHVCPKTQECSFQLTINRRA